MKIRSSIHRLYKTVAYIIESFWIQLAALSGTYGLIVTLYLVLHIFIGERLWIVNMGNNILHLLTMFCVPGLIITLISRKHRIPWSLYLLPGTVAFFILYGNLLIPPTPLSEDSDAIEFSVVTYNVAKQEDALAFATSHRFGAEITGIQEVVARGLDTAKFAHVGGKGIYTLYPIVREEPDIIYRSERKRALVAVRVEVEIEGQTIAVYSFHAFRPTLTVRPFDYNSRLRTSDVRAVMEVVAQDPYPVILFCDCNFSDQTDDYKLMATHLTDAWREKGLGLGLTAIAPAGKGIFPFLLLRSDYIWHSDEFETVSIEVLRVELSDHYPVRATLRLRNTK